ncbi:hypothetical protein PC128_g17729 [Phytophthora cactorum]|nr:hypothetical protein C6341_g17485 [Phytophthora cactorum]KAG3175442.1 hypothetical protein PC128_g17729 [Phytophthora cactorum]
MNNVGHRQGHGRHRNKHHKGRSMDKKKEFSCANELKPELVQRLNAKKGKRQTVSLVNSVHCMHPTTTTEAPRGLFENMTLYSTHPSAGATGATSDGRLLSPIYSPMTS